MMGFRRLLRRIGRLLRILPTVPRESRREDADGPWLAGWIECRICSWRAVSVRPLDAGSDDLECGNCGGMTCDEAEAETEFETSES